MSSMNADQTTVLDVGRPGWVYAVAFQPDGKHLLGGHNGGIQRWRLADREEIRRQTGMEFKAISMSRNRRWIVCGTEEGASVWDTEMREKVTNVEGTNYVGAVDVSPDSTRLATGTGSAGKPDKKASIWNITTGQRLVGPIEHDNNVTGIQFSPNGEHIATACNGGSFIRIFDSQNGDEFATFKADIPAFGPAIPFVWSNDGRQIFAACRENKIKSFDVSTGLQCAELQIPNDGNRDDFVHSLALATNGKFIATFTDHAISFLDTSTFARIDPVIADSEVIRSITISQDDTHLATGRGDGKIVIRDLSKILPDSYGPFNASTHEQLQQPLKSDHDDKPPDSDSAAKSPPPQSKTNGDDGDGNPLDVELPSNTPGLQNYDKAPSPASSAHPLQDERRQASSSRALLQSSDGPPMTSPSEARREVNVDTVQSPRGCSIFKKWRQWKRNNDRASHEPHLASGKSRETADHQSSSQSPVRADAPKQEFSRMAAGKRKPRAVVTSFRRPKRKSPAKADHSNTNTSRSGKGPTDTKETGPGQQLHDPSQPSAAGTQSGPIQEVIDPARRSVSGVRLTRASGKATLSFTFPEWICCGLGTEDGTHGSI